jgi:hypothetical protein
MKQNHLSVRPQKKEMANRHGKNSPSHSPVPNKNYLKARIQLSTGNIAVKRLEKLKHDIELRIEQDNEKAIEILR